MSALQRYAQAVEVARLTSALEEMRIRAETAEARMAAVSGVTREQLVANEREACAVLVERMDPDGKSLVGLIAAIRARGGK